MNKILSKPVSFKLAKLAKEKGFPQPKTITEAKELDLRFTWYNEDGVYKANFKLDNTIQAPTIAEMLDYIFDKYNIWIEVRKHTRNGLSCFSPYIDNKPVKEDIFFNDYDLPFEAYETAIEHTLLNFEK